MPDFRSATRVAKEAGSNAEAQALVDDSRKRARAWLRKDADGKWRPRKRHRCSACEWLRATDNALRVSTGGGGLADFAAPSIGPHLPAVRWPLLVVAADRGSDGVAASNYAKRELQLNMEFVGDPSHDANNDMVNAVQRAGLWPHEALMLAVYNTPHGPWCEDARWRQVLAGLEDLREFQTSSDCPLFEALSPGMLKDSGDPALSHSFDVAELLWERCFEASPWAKKGCKINASRFMTCVRRAREEDANWNFRLFGYLYIALECDMLRGSAFKQLVVPEALVNDGGEETLLRRDTPDEKMLRSACANALVVSVVMLGDPDNQARQRIITATCHELDMWHMAQNRLLRTTVVSGDWLQNQMAGEYIDVLKRTVEAFREPAKHAQVGLMTTQRDILEAGLGPSHASVARDNELVSTWGALVLELIGARLRRNVEWLGGGGGGVAGADCLDDARRRGGPRSSSAIEGRLRVVAPHVFAPVAGCPGDLPPESVRNALRQAVRAHLVGGGLGSHRGGVCAFPEAA